MDHRLREASFAGAGIAVALGIVLFAAPVLIGADDPGRYLVLDNGLRVFLLEKRDLPLLHIVTGFDVGSKNETDATSGIVHLLEHTTGFDDLSLREYAHDDPGIALRDALALNPAPRASRWRPGTRMSYCNSGPPIAAYVVEKLTGRRFEAFVEEHVFAPLGMTTASYFKEPATDDRRATLYRDDGVTPYPYWHIGMRPSGAINASAAEMAGA